MEKYQMSTLFTKVCVATFLSLAIPSITCADAKIVEAQMDAEGMSWTNHSTEGNLMLRVTGPEGFVFEQTFTGTPPAITTFGADGQYRYEITALPALSDEEKDNMRAARKQNNQANMRSLQKKSQKQSGYFRVEGGAVLNSALVEKRSTK